MFDVKRLIAGGLLAIALFASGAFWQARRDAVAETARIEQALDRYKRDVAREVERSTLASNSLVTDLKATQDSNVATRTLVATRLKRQLQQPRIENDIQPIETPTNRVLHDPTGPLACAGDGSAYRFDIGTIRLLNAARANVPAADPTSDDDGEGRTTSTIGIEAFVANDLEIILKYHELAARHNALVDYINNKDKK